MQNSLNETTMEFSTREFRQALGLFATGVCVATTNSRFGKIGITINSFASVSLTPPLVLFSVARSLRSCEEFEESEGFCVNVLSQKQRELSDLFARTGEDKWKDLQPLYGSASGLILPDALVSFDCKKHAVYDGGDHVIIVGKVLSIRVAEEEVAPLVYFRSAYRDLSH